MSIKTARHGAVGMVTLARPEVANAIDATTTLAVSRTLDEYETDPTVRCVLLTGSGQRAFCAGMDLKAFAKTGLEGIGIQKGGFAGITRRRLRKPLVAAVNGAAVGGGFEIVLACDLVVAAEHATFSFPEILRGLFPASGGLVRLPRRLPAPVATELALTGEPLSARRALELGLINRVVATEDLLDAALEVAEKIAGFDPLAVQAVTSVIDSSLEEGEEAGWEANDHWDPIVFRRQEARENAAAFSNRSETAGSR